MIFHLTVFNEMLQKANLHKTCKTEYDAYLVFEPYLQII